MERRGILKGLFAGVAGVWGARFAAPERAAAQTKHIRLYVEMDIAPRASARCSTSFTTSSFPKRSSTKATSA